MSLSKQVLIGLALGIAAGVFFGERAASLQIVGDAFIRLLQMTVMPFIAVSLIAALGKLERDVPEAYGIAGVVTVAVVGSILAHGLTAKPLAEAFARSEKARSAGR